MQGERLRTDHSCYHCLMLELHDRRSHDAVRLRIEHHELIRMKTEPDFMVPRSIGRFCQRLADLCPSRKIRGVISTHRVCRERHELARDPEGADPQLTASCDRIDQRLRIGENYLRQVFPTLLRRQSGEVSMS